MVILSFRVIFILAFTILPTQHQWMSDGMLGIFTGMPADITNNQNIIFSEDFETDDFFQGLHRQFSAEYSFQVVASPVYSGARAGRFDLRDSDSMISNGTRAEVLFDVPEHKERWYSLAIFFPSDKYKYDRNNDIINQWHQQGSPATSFRVRGDRFVIRTGSTKATRKEFDLGLVTKDTWHHFVFHVIHSSSDDGLVEVWHNRTKVFAKSGGNMYEGRLPRWKVGIYKDNWNENRVTDSDRRVYYIDVIKIGNQSASLHDMW